MKIAKTQAIAEKEKISAILSNDLKNQILGMYDQKTNIDKLYVLEKIPVKLLANAIETYFHKLSQDEIVICLYDDTAFGSAKDGFTITTKQIYYKNIFEHGSSTNIADVLSINQERHNSIQNIVIRTSSSTAKIHIDSALKKKDALVNFVDRLVTLLKKSNYGSTAEKSHGLDTHLSTCSGCGASFTKPKGISRNCDYCGSLI